MTSLVAINHARATGSVGGRDLLEENGETKVLADVVALNDDGSQQKAFSFA